MTFRPSHYNLRHWEPSEYIPCHDLRPPVPCLIALNRKPYRLIEIREMPASEWEDSDWEAYESSVAWRRNAGKPYPAPEEWNLRPVRFVVTKPGDEQRLSSRVPIWNSHRRNGWYLLNEHRAVCASCGELAPCREYIASRMRDFEAERAREKLEKNLAKVPGCCWGCGEPITHRQKHIEFEGDNADLPGAPPALFHARMKCSEEARAYEQRWAAVDPRRRRKLTCDGKIILHVDGAECSEGALCPGEQARHSSYVHHRNGMHGICLRCKDARARQLMAGEDPSTEA